ncbi:hypothetical protein FACS1894137_06290 [Spirochaetia bacterium]|nr:hypothetical protein FACS1894137_06290 [Spirochaetia bacterium]
MEDYEILTTILSALEWRRFNGDIKMITDETGAEYYRSLGIEHVWNLGVETTLNSNDRLAKIDPFLFWAAGKIFALQRQKVQCVMLDTDFIVWDKISEISEFVIVVAHREYISDTVYPDASAFEMRKGYHFPIEWNWSALPCNTAFLFMGDEAFKTYYTDTSIQFIMSLINGPTNIATMVFAEQRLLAMCAEIKDIPIKTLMDVDFLEEQKSFTHIWGFKNTLKSDRKTRDDFCLRCVERILKDFPGEENMLSGIDVIQPYYKIYRSKQ